MRILQLGFGTVGKENVRQLLKRGHEVVAIVGRNPGRIDIGGFDFAGKPPLVGDNLAECIARSGAELILQATAIDPDDMVRVVEQAAAAKCDIISVNPIIDLRDVSPELYGSLDRIATKAGIRVIGVGVIPGFYSDILPLFMTGACSEVSTIRFRRRADFSKWGLATAAIFGFGLTPQEFERQKSDGKILFFRNLWQSAHLIARELSWPVESTEEFKSPMISDRERNGAYMQVPAGTVGGFTHRVVIHSTQSRSIDLAVSGIMDPKGDDEKLEVYVEIEGNPQLRLDIQGDVLLSSGSVVGTSARVINTIGPLRMAKPGLRTTADLRLVVNAG